MTGLHPASETISVAGTPEEARAQTAAPQWAIVEIFGHRRHVGIVSEAEQFGAKVLRIDVPGPDQTDMLDPTPAVEATFFYGGSSIFGLTMITEERVKAELAQLRGRPSPARLGLASRYNGPDDDYELPEDEG